jgi:hypothetical protein
MTDERRRLLILFLVAAAVGLVGGLAVAWFASPVQYTYVEPSELRLESRVTYLQLVGASFAFEDDWTRARFRLDALRDPNVARQLADVTERAIAEGRPAPWLRALSRISDRLGVRTAAMIIYLATPVPAFTPSFTPTPVRRPTLPPPTLTPTLPPTFAPPDTPTPLPTFTPTPAPLPAYLLIARDRICAPGAPQIRVVVQDEKGDEAPGVEVWVTWDDGADRFVTGLKPEKGQGYGDVDIQPDKTYAVAIAQSALPIAAGIKTEQCPSSDPSQTILASWRLTFGPVPPTITPTPLPTREATATFTPTLTLTTAVAPTGALDATGTATRLP